MIWISSAIDGMALLVFFFFLVSVWDLVGRLERLASCIYRGPAMQALMEYRGLYAGYDI